MSTLPSENVWDSYPEPVEQECLTCFGDRVIEVPVYGRMAAEATRVTRCPKCGDGKPVRSRV